MRKETGNTDGQLPVSQKEQEEEESEGAWRGEVKGNRKRRSLGQRKKRSQTEQEEEVLNGETNKKIWNFLSEYILKPKNYSGEEFPDNFLHWCTQLKYVY